MCPRVILFERLTAEHSVNAENLHVTAPLRCRGEGGPVIGEIRLMRSQPDRRRVAEQHSTLTMVKVHALREVRLSFNRELHGFLLGTEAALAPFLAVWRLPWPDPRCLAARPCPLLRVRRV